ncbi:hypothetical protein AMAG_09303 [Allomyces macrogynus ATCC 38327]|uniref:GPI transamidase component PIG-S n=1 Tax=Allomyces macrogynus (strain ATCC 38327) TaxID=578462 RepID=A0A0L0SP26_ALLM3|nr:hypothetical protein AMAG_09303 [Allomyces macrogynus ATCC 38327]|eukprot:KNE64271.1 hypothetical protein AMAG_09303 [Allomyces macrogynus ATCC 38327]
MAIEFPEYSRRWQRTILAAYLAAFLLGVPGWWSLTRVQRSSLPKHDVFAAGEARTVAVPFAYRIGSDAQCLLAGAQPLKVAAPALQADLIAEIDRILPHAHVSLVRYPDWTLRIEPHVHAENDAVENVPILCHAEGKERRVVFNKNAILISGSASLEYATRLAHATVHLAQLAANAQESIPFSREYEILASLFIEDPAAVSSLGYRSTWSVGPSALEKYIRPFVDALFPTRANGTSPVHLASQVRYFVQPGEGVLTETDQNATEVRIPRDRLPHLVGSDWPVAPSAAAPHRSVVHLVTYVPATPMVVLDGDDVESATPSPFNDFVVPRWGGVVVHNMRDQATRPQEMIVPLGDERKLAETWITHLRDAFGVRRVQGSVQIDTTTLSFPDAGTVTGISATERAVYHLSSAVTHTVETIQTLQALVRLVDQQTNLPVSPTIAREVQTALRGVTSRPTAAWSDMHARARAARAQAEAAFFDPDMVGLMYFPDEHKYAVYMPLFVPVLVTVLSVVVRELRVWQKERKVCIVPVQRAA